MKEVTVTVQFVIKTDVSDDTDLEQMELWTEQSPMTFIAHHYSPSEDFTHVSVEPT